MKLLKKELYNRMILGMQDRLLAQVDIRVYWQVDMRVGSLVDEQVRVQVTGAVEGELK